MQRRRTVQQPVENPFWFNQVQNQLAALSVEQVRMRVLGYPAQLRPAIRSLKLVRKPDRLGNRRNHLVKFDFMKHDYREYAESPNDPKLSDRDLGARG